MAEYVSNLHLPNRLAALENKIMQHIEFLFHFSEYDYASTLKLKHSSAQMPSRT
jgi:hypothetical protein